MRLSYPFSTLSLPLWFSPSSIGEFVAKLEERLWFEPFGAFLPLISLMFFFSFLIFSFSWHLSFPLCFLYMVFLSSFLFFLQTFFPSLYLSFPAPMIPSFLVSNACFYFFCFSPAFSPSQHMYWHRPLSSPFLSSFHPFILFTCAYVAVKHFLIVHQVSLFPLTVHGHRDTLFL